MFLEFSISPGKLVKNDRKKLPQPVIRSRNLLSAPATCYPLIIHRKVVEKAMAATCYPLPQPVIRSRNLLNTPATCYPLPQPVIHS